MRSLVLALLAGAAAAPVQPATAAIHRFHQDHVLGTSMDLVVAGGDSAQAKAAVEAARAEIDRLDAVLSGWRPDSELARLNASPGPFKASPDLFAVIAQCEAWRDRCGGAFSARIGSTEAAYRAAQADDAPLSAATLARIATAAEQADVRLDPRARTIDRAGVVFAVDALAKGYIIDAALRAAHGAAPEQGVMIDIGGDIACAGPAPKTGWRIGVASGADPDNAAPRQVVSLSGGAIATSGGGARDRRIDGCDIAHVLQPGSGAPAARRTVSVVANDAATADALATALGVMPLDQGLGLARNSGAQAHILEASGASHATDGWSGLLQPAIARSTDAPPALRPAGFAQAQNRGWPAGYGLEVAYEIPRPMSGRAKPPFVVIWIADANGKLVKTLFHLGDHPGRYLDANYVWFNALGAAGHANDLFSYTRPSRAAGRYTAVWDGKNDAGVALPQGRYTVNIEVSREHGGHNLQSMTLNLGAAPAAASADAQGEAGAASVRYGPGVGQGSAA